MMGYLTIRELASVLRVNYRTVQLWIGEGAIKTTRFENARGVFIPRDELNRLLNTSDVLEKYYTVKEICEFLGIKDVKGFIKYYIKTNKLRAVKVKGRYLIASKDLENFFNKIYNKQ